MHEGTLEDVFQENKRNKSYPTVRPVIYKNGQPEKTCPLMQYCHKCHYTNQPLSTWIYGLLYRLKAIPGSFIAEDLVGFCLVGWFLSTLHELESSGKSNHN